MAGKRGRKRKNHGTRVLAGSLAWDTLGFRLSRERIRLVRLQLAWPEVAPLGLTDHVWPSSVSGDELTLTATSSQWLHEFTYLRDDLLLRIQERCPEAGIQRLRCRPGHAPPRPPPPRELPRLPDPPRVILPPQPCPETLEALEHVRDETLRRLIANARMALTRP